jgi:hypothetical protein
VRQARAREFILAAVVSGLCALTPACSSGPPLGGPFGGEGYTVNPTNGTYIDGGTYTPPEPPPPVAGGNPGTWNHIFGAYLQRGAAGDCGFCHAAEMRTPATSYNWLRDLEYVGTSPPLLTDFGQSCLAWFGGTMPPGVVPANDALVQEITAWAKNGGKND